jgi:hypothetical protein
MAFNPKIRRYLVIFLVIAWAVSLSYFATRSKKQSHPQIKLEIKSNTPSGERGDNYSASDK